MSLKSLEFLLKSEIRSRDYLTKKCWGGKRRYCIRCRSAKIYHLSDKRYRCRRCKYTFRDFTGRWIGQLNLSAKKWLWIVKLFELEIPLPRLAKEVDISYPTALKAAHTIRCAIVQPAQRTNHAMNGEDFGAFDFANPRAGDAQKTRIETAVLGMRKRNGKVELALIRDLAPEAILDGKITIVRRGSMLCTDRFGNYDALLFYAPRCFDILHRKSSAQKKIYIDQEGFWSFAKQRLMKRFTAAQRNWPLYLKELEFRYNHRHGDLYELLLEKLTQSVPKRL